MEFAGLNSLTNIERLSRIDKLFPETFIISQTSNGLRSLIIIFAGLSIIFAISLIVIRYRKENKPIKVLKIQHRPLTYNILTAPKGLYFDRTHTWVFMEKDGSVKIGIDDFLQHVIGQITSIKMKKPGEKIIKGEQILTIVQNGKRLNICSPLSGIIIGDNSNLLPESSLINSSPYFDGWIYKIQPSNWIRENQFLFIVEKYTEWIKDEFIRLKDFLANNNSKEYAYVTLQDGGEIVDGVLENLEPEVWEDFQTKFIDIKNNK